MHRHCSISHEHGFNDATECPMPIHYARLARKCSLILYGLVRLPDSWCAFELIGAFCSSMAVCGSATRTAQVRAHAKRSAALV
eukprot:5434424-Pleurochrysis_carterae.AAC.1